MSTIKRVAKNTLWLTAAEIGAKGLGFVIAIVIARYLGPEDYGKYAFAISFVTLFMVLADFGMRPLLVREVARNNQLAEKYLANFLTLKIWLTLVLFGAVALAAWIYGTPLNLFILIMIAAAEIAANSFSEIFRGIFQAFERMKYEMTSRVLNKVLILAGTIGVIILGLRTLSIMLVLLLAGIVTAIYTIIVCRKYFARLKLAFDKVFLKEAFKQSFIFAITNVFISIYFKIDSVMLEKMRSVAEVGYYNTAYELVFAFMFVPTIFSAAIYPVLSRFYKDDPGKIQNLVARFLKYYTLTAVALTVFLILLGAPLIHLFYGAQYDPSIILFQQLVVVLIFVFLNYLGGTLLNASNKQIVTTIAAGICAGVNIALNLWLIPAYGASGAAVATIITEAILCLITFIYIDRRLYRIFTRANWFKGFKVAALVIATGLLAYYLAQINIYLSAMASLGLFVGLVFALRLYNSQDREYLQVMLRRQNKISPEEPIE